MLTEMLPTPMLANFDRNVTTCWREDGRFLRCVSVWSGAKGARDALKRRFSWFPYWIPKMQKKKGANLADFKIAAK